MTSEAQDPTPPVLRAGRSFRSTRPDDTAWGVRVEGGGETFVVDEMREGDRTVRLFGVAHSQYRDGPASFDADTAEAIGRELIAAATTLRENRAVTP